MFWRRAENARTSGRTEFVLNLKGTLPDLCGLQHLEVLGVGFSSLSGPVPDLSKLEQLRNVYLRKNNFSGSLPDMSKLKFLDDLSVSNNKNLYGVISKETILRAEMVGFGGCKQRRDCSQLQKWRNCGWMQFPFIVGFSFASGALGTRL